MILGVISEDPEIVKLLRAVSASMAAICGADADLEYFGEAASLMEIVLDDETDDVVFPNDFIPFLAWWQDQRMRYQTNFPLCGPRQ